MDFLFIFSKKSLIKLKGRIKIIAMETYGVKTISVLL